MEEEERQHLIELIEEEEYLRVNLIELLIIRIETTEETRMWIEVHLKGEHITAFDVSFQLYLIVDIQLNVRRKMLPLYQLMLT